MLQTYKEKNRKDTCSHSQLYECHTCFKFFKKESILQIELKPAHAILISSLFYSPLLASTENLSTLSLFSGNGTTRDPVSKAINTNNFSFFPFFQPSVPLLTQANVSVAKC